MSIRNYLIKILGGYTPKEYTRIERKYQGLLDSMTTDRHVKICNEYIYRVLKSLHDYAKNKLYQDENWTSKMYNVIHNNMYRLLIRYLHCNSSVIYQIDTTLDNKNEFLNIMAKELGEFNIEDYADTILEND